jgi:hypothetical protein
VAAVGALWGNCNWGGGNVNINTNRYNSINTNRQIAANRSNWQHNAANRRGTPYRDQRSQQQFGRNVPGAENRADFRGRDNTARNAERQRAQSALQQRGMDPAQGRQNLRNDPATRERAQQAAGNFDRGGRAGDQAGLRSGDRAAGQADRGGQFGGGNRSQGLQQVQSRPSADNAFRGAGGGSAQTRQQFDRGAASRQSMSNFGGGHANVSRPQPSSAGRSGGFSGGHSGGFSGASRGGGGFSGGGARGAGGGGRGGGRR